MEFSPFVSIISVIAIYRVFRVKVYSLPSLLVMFLLLLFQENSFITKYPVACELCTFARDSATTSTIWVLILGQNWTQNLLLLLLKDFDVSSMNFWPFWFIWDLRFSWHLRMEAAWFSKTLVSYLITTWYHKPEDSTWISGLWLLLGVKEVIFEWEYW